MSLEFRTPCINGNVDSYHESADLNSSKNQIDSMHLLNSPTNKVKKESIYKAALQKHTSSKVIQMKATPQDYDSYYSQASSREEMDNESKGSRSPEKRSQRDSREGSEDPEKDKEVNLPKKSKFGAREN